MLWWLSSSYPLFCVECVCVCVWKKEDRMNFWKKKWNGREGDFEILCYFAFFCSVRCSGVLFFDICVRIIFFPSFCVRGSSSLVVVSFCLTNKKCPLKDVLSQQRKLIFRELERLVIFSNPCTQGSWWCTGLVGCVIKTFSTLKTPRRRFNIFSEALRLGVMPVTERRAKEEEESFASSNYTTMYCSGIPQNKITRIRKHEHSFLAQRTSSCENTPISRDFCVRITFFELLLGFRKMRTGYDFETSSSWSHASKRNHTLHCFKIRFAERILIQM